MTRGAADVRHHRPALRPRQPDHDVPARRALAPHRRGDRSRCRRAARCSTWPAAPATCASISPSPGLRPISIDLSFGMLSADRSGAPRVQADILRLPVPDCSVDGVTCGFALRNLVDLPTFFAELARVVRPGGRIALLDVGIPAQPRRPLGQQHLLRQGRAQDRRAAQRRRRRTGTCRRASPTCRPGSR